MYHSQPAEATTTFQPARPSRPIHSASLGSNSRASTTARVSAPLARIEA